MTTRTRDLVDKKEIDELLNYLRNAGNLTDTMALQSIGYKNPNSVLTQMKLFDACRKAREVFPARGSKFMTLQARIAEHMMKVAKKGS